MRKRSFKLWEREVKTAIATRALMPWLIGDLLNYGEANYGERYAQALDERMVQYHTVQNWRWICRCFPASRRRESLSWTHHEVVANLPEKQQDTWLARAERNGWSTRELRDVIRIHQEGNKADIVIDKRFAGDFERWVIETTLRTELLKTIKRGSVEVIGFDKRKHMPLVKPKVKAA